MKIKRKEGPISLFLFFCITLIFYNIIIPIEVLLSNNPFYLIGTENQSELNDSVIKYLILFSILALLGFYFGSKLMSFETKHRAISERAIINQSIGNFNSLFLLILIIFCFCFFRNEIQASGSYAGNVQNIYENPVFSLVTELIVLISSINAALIIYKEKSYWNNSLIYISICVAWGLYSSSKDSIFIGLLPFLINLNFQKLKNSYFHFILKVALIIIFLPVGLLGFSLFRSGIFPNINQIALLLRLGIFKNTDPAGPLYVFQSILESTKTKLYGSSFIDSILILIPKTIWPSRPLDLAEKFARENMGNWMPGQGKGFSLLIEGYMNFGIIGVMLPYLFIAIWFSLSYKVMRIFFGSQRQIYMHFSFLTIGFYTILTMHRGPLAGFVKTHFIYLIISILVVSLEKLSIKYYGKNHLAS